MTINRYLHDHTKESLCTGMQMFAGGSEKSERKVKSIKAKYR